MKCYLLFVGERFVATLDERRLTIVLRQHGIGKPNDSADTQAKLFAAFLGNIDESVLGRIMVTVAIQQAAQAPNESSKALKAAAA